MPNVDNRRQDNMIKYKNVVFSVGLFVITATFVIIILTGGNYIKHKETPQNTTSQSQSYDEDYDYNGYEINQIIFYSHDRFFDFIKKYNINYTIENKKMNFDYTTEDWKKISELDETYLRDFYVFSTEESFLEVLKKFGYADLDMYLIENEYINSDGSPNKVVWAEATCSKISEEMLEKGIEKETKEEKKN